MPESARQKTVVHIGRLPERLIGAVLKTDGSVMNGHGGSNPSPSAYHPRGLEPDTGNTNAVEAVFNGRVNGVFL